MADFEGYLAAFETMFPASSAGPELRLHRRAVQSLSASTLAGVLADGDDEYHDWVYGTLMAWGMHRPNTSTQLVPFQSYQASVCSPANAGFAQSLAGYSITNLAPENVPAVKSTLWQLVLGLQVGVSQVSKLVVNSKVLHHLLPDLVPPIDRKYTLMFFFDDTSIGGLSDQQVQFEAIYQQFFEIAEAKKDFIEGKVGQLAWHTSVSKVIDNTIIGFVESGSTTA